MKSNSYVGAENIFIHKKYFSKDRNDYIETDITIEIKIQNFLFLIIVVECKDYKTSLDVSEIEEFHSKLQQIGADNTKGIIVTSNGKFKKAAINYSKSKGITLARLHDDNINCGLSIADEHFCVTHFCYLETEKHKEAIDHNDIDFERIINEIQNELEKYHLTSQDILECMGKTIQETKTVSNDRNDGSRLENYSENVQIHNGNKSIINQEQNSEGLKTSNEIEVNIDAEDLFRELSYLLEILNLHL